MRGISSIVLLGILALALAYPTYKAIGQEARAATSSSWVAFAADMRVVTASGAEQRGRFYRRSDGSMRVDTFDGDDTAVVISNFSRRLQYRHAPRYPVWTEQPLVLAHGTRPLALSEGVLRRLVASGQNVEGFDVVEERTVGGQRLVRAPALNHFPVIVEMPGVAKVEYVHIQLGEPELSLFDPPAGVQLKRLSAPADVRGPGSR